MKLVSKVICKSYLMAGDTNYIAFELGKTQGGVTSVGVIYIQKTHNKCSQSCFYERIKKKMFDSTLKWSSMEEKQRLLQLLYVTYSLAQLVQPSTALHCAAVGWRVNDIHI